MSRKIIIYSVIIAAVIMSLTLYCIHDALKKSYEMHECNHQLVEITRLLHNKIDRNLKESQYLVSNSEDQEKEKLEAENLGLRRQNEKLTIELLNMFNLLRGREVPANKPASKIEI